MSVAEATPEHGNISLEERKTSLSQKTSNLSEPATISQPVVILIEVSGAKRVTENAVRAKISHKVNEPVSSEKISNDIKEIYKMGYFDDVKVEMEPVPGGVKLIYVLKEKPTIQKINFEGNEEFDDQKLRENISISPGSIADATLIQDNASKIKALYEEKGYYLTNVIPVLRKLREDTVSLTFMIEEGPVVKIKRIIIEGAEKIPPEKVKKVMKTKERGFFSFLTKSGYYKKDEMRNDIERIKDLYLNNGYIKIAVSNPELMISEDKRTMEIKIAIQEGEQYRIDSIAVEGNRSYPEDEIRKLLSIKRNDIFSREALRKDISSIVNFYSERGYALATVIPDVIPDDSKKTVELILRVQEGDLFRIGRIEIFGNTKTWDKVIRREMRLDEGDIFNSKLLRRSYERINNLQFFETVELNPKPDAEEKKVDIDIKVKERPTGMLSVGGGYSSIDRWVAMVDLSQGNLGGRGQYLKLRGEFGGRRTLYELSYRDPWFLDKPLSFGLSVYKSSREYPLYDRRATGFEISFGKSFTEYWGGSLSYNLEKVTIENVDDAASQFIKDQQGTRVTSSISPTIARDSRDNFLDPSRGSRNAIYLTVAGLGGTNGFIRSVFDSAWFFPWGKTTFSLRGRIGYASGAFGKDLPIYERFYVGGIYTVRGLGFGEAGPVDENNEPIGGTKELIFNLEYIFPLIEEARLKGVLFFDAGKAFEQSEPMDSLRRTAGFGIRWISPIGPIRLEYGRNLDPKPHESKGRVEFTFGTFF
ncbi:MAG: outer membrane protein assembly factor BamA [Thermodesulfovibrionales bacterium]|nr:outer membrane protein assembly factor BamA [Thermodesulfovibrionales bacterium]